MKKRQIKVLFYDIETSPNTAFVWGRYEQNVLSYLKEWEILSCAYKWQGEKKVHCLSRQHNKTDKELVIAIHKLFQEADIIIAHNGDQFDQKKVKTRMLYHKLPPPKILSSIDTKKAAKVFFNFNSNSLNDLGTYLGLGQKFKHSGFDMWLGCLNGDKKSWKEMIYYNKQDVVLLEKVYNALKPWIQDHPNMAKLLNPFQNEVKDCPHCGSRNTMKRGYRATRATLKQQMVCKDCGAWFLTRVLKD